MNCPVDNEQLLMSDKQGVEIDYCPKCRGVWLDRGELDKIIDKASSLPGSGSVYQQPTPSQQPPQYNNYQQQRSEPQPQYDQRQYPDKHDDDYKYKKKKKKENFLGDLFDF